MRTITRGNTAQKLVWQLLYDGLPVALAGASVTLRMRKSGSGSVDLAMTVEDEGLATVSVQFTDEDYEVLVAGTYDLKFIVTFADTTVWPKPSHGVEKLKLIDNLP